MKLTVNGKPLTFESGTLEVPTLLQQLGIDPKLVVIELNHHILPAESYHNITLTDGDSIELIQFVGGG